MKYFNGKKEIQRSGDLAPMGIRSTIKGDYGFNETFTHIYQEARKSIQEWNQLKSKEQ